MCRDVELKSTVTSGFSPCREMCMNKAQRIWMSRRESADTIPTSTRTILVVMMPVTAAKSQGLAYGPDKLGGATESARRVHRHRRRV